MTRQKTIKRRNDDNRPHSLGSFGQWHSIIDRDKIRQYHGTQNIFQWRWLWGENLFDKLWTKVNILSRSYIERGDIGWEGLCVVLLLTVKKAACYRAQLRRAILTWEICFSAWSVSTIASHLLEERRHTSLILVHHIYMFADDVLPVTSKCARIEGVLPTPWSLPAPTMLRILH